MLDPDVSNIMCYHCKYWHCNPAKSQCKCLDHSKVHFFRPWFSSDVMTGHHTICGAFEPNRTAAPAIAYEWDILGGFSEWHRLFIAQWHNGKEIKTAVIIKAVSATDREHSDDRYIVPYTDFINCNIMRPDGIHYLDYRHIERSRKNVTGYIWISEGPGILKVGDDG